MEEESGIGGRMVRTKTNKATKAGKVKRDRAGEGRAPLSEPAEQGVVEERVLMIAQVTETALQGKDVSAWEGLGEDPGAHEDAAKANGFSQALAWKAEPEWQGECSEAEAETAAGSREPEGLN